MSEVYDGAWRLFDHNPETGRTIWVLHDGTQMVFRVDQPVDHILEANEEAVKDTMGQSFGDWNRAASVPLQLFHNSGMQEAMQQGDHVWVSRFLNDADNRKLRTSRGSV